MFLLVPCWQALKACNRCLCRIDAVRCGAVSEMTAEEGSTLVFLMAVYMTFCYVNGDI